jgi:molybdate transport system regulatory protein
VEPKLRVWVVFGKRLKFGDGRARLLESIDARGSLQQAAAEFDMSYRNAWGYLRELEAAAGFRFVERSSSRGRRGGMRLTPAGRDFLRRYRTFQRGLESAALRRFRQAFPARTLTSRPR